MENNDLKSLRIIYFALAAGIMVFMIISIFLNSTIGAFLGNNLAVRNISVFVIILIVFTGSAFVAYRFVTQKKLDNLKALAGLENKLIAWRELLIIKGALIEGPSFFAIVLFLLLGLHALLLWPVAGVILFWLTKPTRESLIEEAQLTYAEIEEFDRNTKSANYYKD